MNTHRKIAPSTEPAVITGFITAVVAALVVLGTEFGLDLSDGQQTAINSLAVVLAPAIAAIIIRSQVTPNAAVLEQNIGGTVVAGAGHDTIPEGEPIRAVHDA